MIKRVKRFLAKQSTELHMVLVCPLANGPEPYKITGLFVTWTVKNSNQQNSFDRK